MPPFLTQSISMRARRVGNGADIGHDDHRRLLLEQLRDRFGEIGARWLDQIGEGLQRAADVIERRQQAAAPGRLPTATAGRRGGAWNSRRARGRRRPAARHRWRSRQNRCAVRTAPSSAPCLRSRPGRRRWWHRRCAGPCRRKRRRSPGGAPDRRLARIAVRVKPSTSFSERGQADAIEALGRGPEQACRRSAKQRREGGFVAVGGQAVGKHGDACAGQRFKRCRDAGIDGGAVGRNRARLGGAQAVARRLGVERADLGSSAFPR